MEKMGENREGSCSVLEEKGDGAAVEREMLRGDGCVLEKERGRG